MPLAVGCPFKAGSRGQYQSVSEPYLAMLSHGAHMAPSVPALGCAWSQERRRGRMSPDAILVA